RLHTYALPGSGFRTRLTLRIVAYQRLYSRVPSGPQFSSECAKRLAPNLRSNAQPRADQTIVVTSWPGKKSDRPDWLYLCPLDHVRLRDWFDKPLHHLGHSWPQRSGHVSPPGHHRGRTEYRQNNLEPQ